MSDSVEVAGRSRTFTVVGTRNGPPVRALVLIFHGSRQTGEKHRAFTGRTFDAPAESGAAVVAYLDGFKGNWNDARRGDGFPARRHAIDDVAFTRAVIDKLAASHGIDRGRVFAVGFSNGGQMVIRLLHDAPELIAGAAVIAATMPAPEDFLVTDAVPVPKPVLLIHGTKDPIMDYDGGEMKRWVRIVFKVRGRALSMPETARYFAARNGVTAQPVVTKLPAQDAGKTSVERSEYAQPGRPPVVLYTVHGGGHTVPGSPDVPAVVGRTSHDVVAAELVTELFGIGA
jgi:polyhydroxybutyrate depolymerase